MNQQTQSRSRWPLFKGIFSSIYRIISCGLLCFCATGCQGMSHKFAKDVRSILEVSRNYPINDKSLKNAALELFPKGSKYKEVYSHFKNKERLIKEKRDYDSSKWQRIRFFFEHNAKRGERGIGFAVTWDSFPIYNHLYTLAYIFDDEEDGVIEVRSGTLSESF